MEEETVRSFKPRKYLYGGMFNKDGDILLCINGKEVRLSGGLVYWADVCQFINERWIPAFLYRKIEEDTGIPASLINKKIQLLAATYNVYSDNFREEHSAIIIGEVDDEQAIKENVNFFDIHEVIDFIDADQIKKPQQILIMRMLASRDCPNSYHRKFAGNWLQSQT